MFLLITGQDSYRALERARELEAAYREKYDAEGRSVERLPPGAEGVERLLAATSGGSLFSARRFIRMDGLLASCPKAKREAVLRALGRDVEMTIVVSLEPGTPTAKDLRGFAELPKFFRYDFPQLDRAPFAAWARAHAATAGVADAASIAALIESSNGDSWFFVTECEKLRAGASPADARAKEVSVYDAVDAYLQNRLDRHVKARLLDNAAGLIAQFPNSARSLALVAAGCREGVHPFVAQKLSRMRVPSPAERFHCLAMAFVWSRTGQASAEEALEILG